MPSRSLELDGSSRQAPRRPWIEAVVFAVVAALGALYVQWPYFSTYHTNDEIFFQLEIGYLVTGRMAWLTYLAREYNGQLFPLWKAAYYLGWRAFGLDALWPWHAVILAGHVLSAWCVFTLARRYLESLAGAAAAGLLWSQAAIGGWDNPLAWIGAGSIVWSLASLLGAMVAVSHFDSGRSALWAALMAMYLTAAMLFWGVAWVVAPVLPLQYWLLERRAGDRPRRRLAWLAAWLVPFVVFGIWQVLAGPAGLAETRRQLGAGEMTASPVIAAERTVAQLAGSLVNLLGGDPNASPTQHLMPKMAAAAIVVLVILIVARGRRALLFVGFALSAVYLLLAHAARADLPAEVTLAWGRYGYLPALSWCLALGVLVDAVSSGRRWRRRLAWALLIVWLPLSALNQRTIAAATAARFDAERGAARFHFVENKRVLEWLSQYALAQKTVLRLPQIPMDVPPVRDVGFPLSVFVAICFPAGLEHVEVVPIDEFTAADQRELVRALKAAPRPLAPQWLEAMDQAVTMRRRLGWLSARADESEMVACLPRGLRLSFGEVTLWLSQFIQESFAEIPPRLRIDTPGDDCTPEQIARTLELVREHDAPEARFWHRQLEPLANKPEAGEEKP